MEPASDLLDVTTIPMEDVADFMQNEVVGMPNSMRAIGLTRSCALLIDGEMYELDPGDVLIDAPQKMQRRACGADLFHFLFGANLA